MKKKKQRRQQRAPESSHHLLADYLTTKQLCRRLRISRITLYRWNKENKGPKPFFKKDGWPVLYLKTEIRAWERKQKKETS